jgi:hypothetical protein
MRRSSALDVADAAGFKFGENVSLDEDDRLEELLDAVKICRGLITPGQGLRKSSASPRLIHTYLG